MLNELERRIIQSSVTRISRVRIGMSKNSDGYDLLSKSEIELYQIINSDKKPVEKDVENLLKWIRIHDALSIPDMARYANMPIDLLRKVVNKTLNTNGKPHKLPEKYLDKLVEFCSDYGYK